MKKLIATIVVLVALVATWFASYDYTIKTLEPRYMAWANTFLVMDYLGNLNEYKGVIE